MAVALLHDTHGAFDAVQQAFLVAATKPHRVPSPDPWPWFAQVVLNEVRNQRRKKRPQLGTHAETAMIDDNSPAREAARSETRETLRSALDTLPEHEREAVALTQLSGMTHAQAAASLGIPVKTVSTHVARGLDRLRGRLGGQADEMLAGFAAAPLMQPLGGWDSALAAWKVAAFSSMSSGAAAAATTGAIMAKGVWIAASAALVIGMAGGAAMYHVWEIHHDPHVLEQVIARHHPEMAQTDPAAGPTQDSGEVATAHVDERLRRETRDAMDRAQRAETARDSLRAEKSDVLAERDALQTQLDALTAELAPLREAAAEKGPTFTFGKYGAIEGVTQSDWKELSHAARTVADLIREIRALQRKGQPVPNELYVKQQQYTEMVRKYEYKTLSVLPSAAKHNGELTHPISHANLVAGELKQADLPLTDAQVKRIEELGLRYETDYEAAQKRYGPTTPRCEKLLDEFLLKGTFVDAVWDVLTTEQRAVFVSPETLHVAGSDLYCPTLMLIHTSPVVSGADGAEIRTKVRGLLIERFKIAADHQQALDLALDAWLAEVSTILAAVPRATARSYTYAQAVVAVRAHVKLAKAVLDSCGLGDDPRAALIDDYTVYIPRVLEQG